MLDTCEICGEGNVIVDDNGCCRSCCIKYTYTYRESQKKVRMNRTESTHKIGEVFDEEWEYKGEKKIPDLGEVYITHDGFVKKAYETSDVPCEILCPRKTLEKSKFTQVQETIGKIHNLLEVLEEIINEEDEAEKQPDFKLPVVSGTLEHSNLDFERACLVHIERLQNGIGSYDSAMLSTFCDAVRMVREYNDMMQTIPPPANRGE